jgi:hypothetical protein
MTGHNFGEPELRLLSELLHVQSLELIDIALTSRGLEYVAQMSELKYLEIQGDALTDELLLPLEKARQLKNVWLSCEECSEDAVEKLQRALPACRVSLDVRQ